MKRLISLVVCVVLIFSFAGCQNDDANTLMEREGKIKIGMITYDENDDIKNAKSGFMQGLKDLGIDYKIEIEYKNAKGNMDELHKMCDNIFYKNDIVVTLGETATTVAKSERKDEQKPIFFVGVNNPVTSSLVSNIITPSNNITGIMSKVTPDCIFSFAVDKIGGQLRKVGIIYNTSEINPAYEINELKDYLNSNSIKYFEGVISDGFDAQQATLEIAGSRVLSLEGDGKWENPKTVYVISNDEVSKGAIPSIAPIIKGVGAVAFILGEAELPNSNFYSILPDYETMGYQCTSIINEYINGVDVIAISAKSSEGYVLHEFEGEEESEISFEITEMPATEENENTEQ
jgi:putative ABC transport system substrate-binding protein